VDFLLTYNQKKTKTSLGKLVSRFSKCIKIDLNFELNFFYNHKNQSNDFFFTDNEDFLLINGLVYSFENKNLDNENDDLTEIFHFFKKYNFEETLKKIDGDFSLIFFSKEKQKLFFSRDIFGVFSLYFSKKKNGIAISSKPSLIHNNGLCSNLASKEYIYRYAGLHYRMLDNNPEKSPYTDISQVPSSNFIIYDIHSDQISKKKYWKLEEINSILPGSEDELSEIYKEILRESVKKRISNKKKKIFSISGGLDSSSILCLASDILQTKVNSYSVTYDDDEYDETEEIQDIISTRSNKWINVQLEDDIDLDKNLYKIIQINDEPVATATWYTHFLATKKIKKEGYDLVYGGLGGDEFNAGEYEYFTFFFADCYKNNQDSLDNEIKLWEKYHNHEIFKKNKKIAFENLKKFTDLKTSGKCLIDRERSFKYLDCLKKENFVDLKLDYNLDCHFESFLQNRTFHDLFYETLPCCLRAQNRHSSFFDLQTINPFLSKEVAEFMFKIPYNLKIKNGITKYLLRKSMRRILPEKTRKRIKKTGWNAPAHLWFTGKNIEFIKDELLSKKFSDKGIYDINKTMEIINEHEEIVINKKKMENHMMFIWQLANMIQWNKLVEIRL
tara:strand:+ start:36136 stop:37977 length:1842 start_codon:yes stop_codon:yes gene_type:complete